MDELTSTQKIANDKIVKSDDDTGSVLNNFFLNNVCDLKRTNANLKIC